MTTSLRWQLMLPSTLVLVGALGLLLLERNHRASQLRDLTQLQAQRDDLIQALAPLAEKHARTVARAREAMYASHPADRATVLTWANDHYLSETQGIIDHFTREVRALVPTAADPQLATDLTRLERQTARVLAAAEQTAAALASLRDADATDEPEDLGAALKELAQADRELAESLRVAQALVSTALLPQIASIRQRPDHFRRHLLLLFAVALPLVLWQGLAPGRRLRNLSHGSQGFVPKSSEEQALHQRLSSLEHNCTQLEGNLRERNREGDRWQHVGRRLERELALFKLYHDNLVSSLRSAIVVTDTDNIVTAFNRSARQLLGLPHDAVGSDFRHHALYRAVADRCHNADRDLSAALASSEAIHFEGVALPATQADSANIPSDNTEHLLDISVVAYRDESDTARGLLWVADDVTEQMRIKGQLLAAERLAAVGRLSAQVAHEIRNPLSAIALNADMLREEYNHLLKEPARSESGVLLANIAQEIERLTVVTESYLQMARLPHPSFSNTDINQLIGELCAMLNEELKNHHITVDLDLASPAPRAWVDPGQMRQALLNIIRNGREAMPQGGTLKVATTQHHDHIKIAIADQGPGIPAANLPRIFEPFFSTKPAGTGLGLSLTAQIISEHAGQIVVQNNQPAGALFTLSLPTRLPASS